MSLTLKSTVPAGVGPEELLDVCSHLLFALVCSCICLKSWLLTLMYNAWPWALPCLRYKGCKRGFWLLLPVNTVQTEETGAWQCSSAHADLLLFPEDVKLFTAPANKVRIMAVLSCYQCRKVQPLLRELCLLTGSWQLSICSVWISGRWGAKLLCSVRSRGLPASQLWSSGRCAPQYRGLSFSFFSSRQKAALQLDRPVWKTAGSVYTFCLQVGRKGHVQRRARKEINNLLEVWGFFSDLSLTRFKFRT